MTPMGGETEANYQRIVYPIHHVLKTIEATGATRGSPVTLKVSEARISGSRQAPAKPSYVLSDSPFT
jgi:hypothetical protein